MTSDVDTDECSILLVENTEWTEEYGSLLIETLNNNHVWEYVPFSADSIPHYIDNEDVYPDEYTDYYDDYDLLGAILLVDIVDDFGEETFVGIECYFRFINVVETMIATYVSRVDLNGEL